MASSSVALLRPFLGWRSEGASGTVDVAVIVEAICCHQQQHGRHGASNFSTASAMLVSLFSPAWLSHWIIKDLIFWSGQDSSVSTLSHFATFWALYTLGCRSLPLGRRSRRAGAEDGRAAPDVTRGAHQRRLSDAAVRAPLRPWAARRRRQPCNGNNTDVLYCRILQYGIGRAVCIGCNLFVDRSRIVPR